ncbi:MAG: glycosyltransferase family 2 protein [Bacteroidales bacterium]|nr:glycosyltransferase family 2 protein [Bacteroidales bacterium]HON71277.1 glycosyltransferase family 2 protein [Tenuifilum sp.]
MISVCIPVYNFDVTELVGELIAQANRLQYPIEILIFDDHSHSYFRNRNSQLASHSLVNYLEFDFNIGRSKIRNRLADVATGQWLLFLDCDVMVDDPNYLKRYIENLPNAKVVCGGRKYGPKPFRPELLLRWKYGVKRECRSAYSRQLKPYSSFISGNFLIEYDTFHSIRFNEELSGYGHEDTLLGLDLKKHKVDILHIDNPTIHMGLDSNQEFLEKTDQGVKNLVKILHIMPCMRRDIEKSITLLKVFRFLRKVGMLYPLRWVSRVYTPLLRKQLCGSRPSILLMDLYKLTLLAKLYTKGWRNQSQP